MLTRFTSNPFFIREMHRPRKFTVRKGLKFGFGMGLFLTIFSLILLLSSGEGGHISLILALLALVTVATIPLVAYTTAVVTVKELWAIPFQLLDLTLLSNGRLVEGYILGTLCRFRALFAVILGFAPFAIIGAVYMVFNNCPQYRLGEKIICQPSYSPMSILTGGVGFTVFAMNVIGVCLLSAAFGVFLAVWWRNRLLSSLVALLMSIFATTLVYMTPSFQLSVLFERNLIALPIIYVTCFLFMILARPFARKERKSL